MNNPIWCLRKRFQREFRDVMRVVYLSVKMKTTNSTRTANGVDSRMVDLSKQDWDVSVAQACVVLKNEGIIAVPTDTIYGIAGLAQSTHAVDKLYTIKNRQGAKPIAISVGDVEDVGKWGRVTVSPALLSALLPGPVTVVLERTATLNPDLNPGTSLVGIRVPDSGFVRDVTRACGEPLALTSANPSSSPSTVSIQEFADLWDKLDVVFDGGTLSKSALSRLGSTVVDLSKPEQYTIIRPGSAVEATVAVLRKYGLVEEKKKS